MERRIMLQLLIPLLLIGVSFGNLPEQLHYACTDAGVIQVLNDGIAQYKSLYARAVEGPCIVNRTTSGGGSVKFVIYGCNVMMPVKVTLMEEDQEILGTNIIFGGKGVVGYDLQCTGVPIGGSLTVLQAKIQAGETGYEYKLEHQASLELKMEIKEHDILRSTSSPVKVGTPLNLTISGSDDFRFYAKSCLAEGTKDQVKSLIQDGKSQDIAIISHFTDLAPAFEQGRKQTVALLYAFHFVGSDEITLNCTVFACRNEDATCQTPAHSIVKRGVNEGSSARTESLEAGIRVVDEYYYPTSSGCTLEFLQGHLILATLMYFLLG